MPHHGGCEAAQTALARGRIMVPLVKGASIMKLILCAALIAASGAASAAVNKCVDQEGHVLFTDGQCPAETQQITAQEPPAEAPALAPVLPPVVSPAPRSRWADLPRPLIRKTVSLDVTTLQAARQNLLMLDEQHKPRRLLSSR
jgi:hypothetical protein